VEDGKAEGAACRKIEGEKGRGSHAWGSRVTGKERLRARRDDTIAEQAVTGDERATGRSAVACVKTITKHYAETLRKQRRLTRACATETRHQSG
jgi:hypothetical protein